LLNNLKFKFTKFSQCARIFRHLAVGSLYPLCTLFNGLVAIWQEAAFHSNSKNGCFN